MSVYADVLFVLHAACSSYAPYRYSLRPQESFRESAIVRGDTANAMRVPFEISFGNVYHRRLSLWIFLFLMFHSYNDYGCALVLFFMRNARKGDEKEEEAEDRRE